jgi:hypothetical protein
VWEGGHCEAGVHEAEALLGIAHHCKCGLDALALERIEALGLRLLNPMGQDQLVDLTHQRPPVSRLRPIAGAGHNVNTEFGGGAICTSYL